MAGVPPPLKSTLFRGEEVVHALVCAGVKALENEGSKTSVIVPIFLEPDYDCSSATQLPPEVDASNC